MVTTDDLARMRAQLFFEGDDIRRRISRFCLLLVLSAVIASAGVAGDSTATVIGAMIVAPLMSPILGIVLAMVLNDRRNLLRCVGTVTVSVLVVILLSFLLGLFIVEPVTAATNSQVAARVSPKLLDLLAALATGVVGSIALVRSDISDTLPGVAIAISLVPPLTVVGLTLESGVYNQAWGALLLFLAQRFRDPGDRSGDHGGWTSCSWALIQRPSPAATSPGEVNASASIASSSSSAASTVLRNAPTIADQVSPALAWANARFSHAAWANARSLHQEATNSDLP